MTSTLHDPASDVRATDQLAAAGPDAAPPERTTPDGGGPSARRRDGGRPTDGSRRAALGAGMAVLAAACASPAGRRPPTQPPMTVPLPTVPAPPEPAEAVRHVAKRLTYGPTPQVIADINQLGTQGWISDQLAMPASVDAALDATLATAYPYSRGTAAQVVARGEQWRVVHDLPVATVVRAVCARRQLAELVTSFWWDHLNVDVNLEVAQVHCPSYDSDVIRTRGLGTFRDLLLASARSGAMLQYLDQASSRADGGRVPNENYARELMELHTVGVDAGYTEDDVKAVAHLLSGWTLNSSSGTYLFRSTWHHPGPFADPARTVLGWRPAGLTGEAAGVAFLSHLAAHPATAQRLAHKLAVRFIGEHVRRTDRVVTDAAAAYTAADTAVVPMLRSLLGSPEFAASRDMRIRRPIELLAAGLRATSGTAFDPSRPEDTKWGLHWITSPLSNTPHHWPAPNGYPDADGKWVNVGALIGRWNLATYLASGSAPGFPVNWTAVAAWTTGTTLGAWVDAAGARLGVPVDDAVRARVLATVNRTPSSTVRPANDRWVFQMVIAQLLQSAAFQTR